MTLSPNGLILPASLAAIMERADTLAPRALALESAIASEYASAPIIPATEIPSDAEVAASVARDPFDCSPLIRTRRAARAAWRTLAIDVANAYARIVRATGIAPIPTADATAYESAREMCAAIDRERAIFVSTANAVHPFWTPETNFMFRYVHDVAGHWYATRYVGERADFTFAGEYLAYLAQCATITDARARVALFCEVVSQSAFCSVAGFFGEQKALLSRHASDLQPFADALLEASY